MSATTEAGTPENRLASAMALSTGAQMLAKVLHLALNVVASLALIRYMGPASYGDYVFVLSLSAVFGIISDFGLARIAVREMVREPEASPGILGTAIMARLGLAGLTWLLAQGALLAMNARPEMHLAVAVASLVFVTDALLAVAVVFHTRLALQYEALVQVTAQAIDTALIFWLISREASLVQFVAAPVLSGGIGAALALTLAKGRFRALLAFDGRRLWFLLKEALPVGATVFVVVTYLKMDSIMLGILATSEDVGQYGTAYKPIEYLLLASAVVINTLFPLLARWQSTDQQRFQLLHRRGLQVLLALALPVPVLLLLIAEPLITALYAPEFVRAAPAMVVLGGALVFMTVSTWQGFTLLSGGRQRITLAYDVAGLLLNVCLNFVLIAWLGFIGAAMATLGTAVFISGLSTVAASRLLGVGLDLRSVGAVVLANVALGGTLWGLLALGLPWLAATVLAGCSYPVWLLVCRVTNLKELRLLMPNQRTALEGVSIAEAG